MIGFGTFRSVPATDEVDTPAEHRAWDRDMARAEAEAQDRLPELSDL